jgi:hypothetical protein
MSQFRIPMVSDGRCLRPYGDVAIEDFEKVRRGKPVVITIEEVRNPEHLKKYWALATAVANFCDDFADRYDADFWARSHMPWMIRSFTMNDGRIMFTPKSIALETMGQEAFSRFYDRALFLWSQKIGCDPERLLEHMEAA